VEGVRVKGVMAVGVGLAELFDSGTGLVVLFLATVLAFVLGLVIILSSTVLFERLKELIRIVRGQDGTADRGRSTDESSEEDLPTGHIGWSTALRRRLIRRGTADRSRVRR
jgi:hypothetical protein